MSRILITGDRGLIGSALAHKLRLAGNEVVGYDLVAQQDILNGSSLAAAMQGCTGVVHLAAVSRVIWGEQDPERCRLVNVDGTRNVIKAAAEARSAPWVLFGSSREVYGQAEHMPVKETAPWNPLNSYARSKVAAEELVRSAAEGGLRASIVRFSSVYGSPTDHHDRVAPAFARLAAEGGVLRVEGMRTCIDLTHINDVSDILVHMTACIQDEGPLPTIHLVSGRLTTLPDLASIAVNFSGRGTITIIPPRSYDVEAFVGDPTRARSLLGWNPQVSLEKGMEDLVSAFGFMPMGRRVGQGRGKVVN